MAAPESKQGAAGGLLHPAPEPVDETSRGQGRVLVMDDDAVVRRLVERLLAHVGYTVTSAADGAEALRLYREAAGQGQRFRAVILDLVVTGGMGGEACLQQIRELDPDVRAVLISGFSADPVMAEVRERGFRAILPKPFALEQLLRAIADATA